jgi:hypothetical protein
MINLGFWAKMPRPIMVLAPQQNLSIADDEQVNVGTDGGARCHAATVLHRDLHRHATREDYGYVDPTMVPEGAVLPMQHLL